MKAKYPLYVISKGRWESRKTIKALEAMSQPYHVVVEKQEYRKYAAFVDKKKIIILDESFKDKYDAFTYDPELGKGSGPARNFCWEHSISEGHEKHWIIDDNIMHFLRLHKNKKIRCKTGAFFRCMEDFVDRYKNIGLAAPQYAFFAMRKQKYNPITINTRVMSCILIDNKLPFRWRGRYNEDVDLSIRSLKAGYCNILFYPFLIQKMGTQTLKGGNTDLLYKNGTKKKSEMLKRMHPDIVRLVYRYGRHHHHVDFSKWKNRPLKLKEGITIPDEPNEYGMRLRYL